MATDFGTDVRSLWSAGASVDLDPYFVPITGRLAVGHGVARRFVTPAGSLPWDTDVGLDLRDYLNDSLVPAQLPGIASAVRIEAEKDERVSSATATVSLGADGRLEITLTCETADGPFVLVLAVSALSVDLLSVR